MTDVPDAKVGDEVVLVGTQGENQISVEELADMSASFNYEFVCNINRRVPRIFYKNEDVVAEKNYLF